MPTIHTMMEQLKRSLARVKRGDTWRRFVVGIRTVKYGAPPRYVPVGPLLSSHSARITSDADLHKQRAVNIHTVLALFNEIPVVVLPPQDREPWTIEVPPRAARRCLRRLRELPPNWEVTHEHDWLLTAHVAANLRTPLASPSLNVRIRVDTAGDFESATFRPAHQWQPQIDEWLTPAWPIDIVYTWVDGQDPTWRRRRDRTLSEVSDSALPAPSAHPSSTDSARFMNTDELRYSLRSVHQFASWVRHIYIVTDGQRPAWLTAHPKVTIVDHHEILPSSTFNSHAIESALHRIPGLSERYLYINDDVFFGRMAFPSDYFDGEGRSKYFPSELTIPPGPPQEGDKPIIAAAKNGRDVMMNRFGVPITQRMRHSVHAQRRSVVEQMERELPEDFERLARTPFRSPQDLSVASSLQHWYGQALGKAVPADTHYIYLNITDIGTGQVLDALASLKRYDAFCLNQEEDHPRSAAARAELSKFLETYFPLPAPWEADDQ